MITLAISHKPRVTEKTVLSGDPFFQLQAVAVALLRVVRLAAGFLVRLCVGGRSGRGGLQESRGSTLEDGDGRLASCYLVKQGACHRPTHHSPIHILPPLPLPHTQAHKKVAMRTAREPMRTAAERKDCPKGWAWRNE